MGLWAGESGICLSSANSHHRPRGGLHPPCPLPLLPPSRSPKGGSPTHARTQRHVGQGLRPHGAPLPIASVHTAAPVVSLRSGMCPPYFAHSCACIAPCQLASSRSHGSASGALGLHRPTAPVVLAGGFFSFSWSRVRPAHALAAISPPPF